ncbi:MAG: SHOCT domain-containing protein [Solirubrobacterales bacterium]|nr:SHOCT domain-containing protein [Solirubrobacterales bacterium]
MFSLLKLADYEPGDGILTALAIFFFFIWVWIVITILMDLFRDHEMSGWGKAAWCLFLIVIPVLASLIYLIARGSGMRDRAMQEQADARKQFDQYVRETAGTGPADELQKLDELRKSGAISEEEFTSLKAKILA